MIAVIVRGVLIFLLTLTVGFAAEQTNAPDTVRVGDAQINLRFDDEFTLPQQATLTAWIGRRGNIVAQFYGKFPAPLLTLNVQAVKGGGVRGGTTYPRSPPIIRLRVGQEFELEQLNRDWVLVHEMIHLALPYVGDEQAWLSEGLATYLESIARVRTGDIDRQQLWRDYVKGMPQGLPKEGDRGLDQTHTWGRTYWGGAVFALLADVEIHKRSNNRLSLKDALRAVLNESGGFSFDWSVQQVFQVGDAAIKQSTLTELYARHSTTAVDVDLNALWKQLGINFDGETIKFDDRAPLAATRRAIEGKAR